MVKGTRPPRAPIRPRDPVILDSEPDTDPCSEGGELEFEPIVAIEPGIEVHLVPSGNEAWILAGAGRIGSVDSANIPEIWTCIGDGWAFNGRINDIGGGRAVATVRGHRTK
jgi:hypothetical protein